MEEGAADVEVAPLVAHEEPRREAVDQDPDAGRPGDGIPRDRLGMEHAADALGHNHPDGDEQDERVEQRDEHRALLVAVGVARRGGALRQPEGEHRQQQAGHVAQVVARIGEQTHRAVAEADDELDDDEEQVERNAQHEGPVERRGVGRERMMMVMMRFLCHIV